MVKVKAYRCRLSFDVISWGRNQAEAEDNARAAVSLVDVEHDAHAGERDCLGYPKPLDTPTKVRSLGRVSHEDYEVDEDEIDWPESGIVF